MPEPETEDLACVVRCLKGDASAFEPLVLRYQRVLFTAALRLLGNSEDARDATQNAFVRAYERLDTFDPSRRFFSWIYRIAVNESLNLRRAAHPHEPLPETLETGADALARVEARELSERVQAALMTLTPEYREVVVMRHFVDLSYEEIADMLGIPEKTVKSRLFSARQRLAPLLAVGDRP
jgi:RNA polymerase sigma-70 factor (ECF subfamily)